MSHALLVLNIFAEDRNFLQYDYTPVTLFLQLLLNIFAETRKFLSCDAAPIPPFFRIGVVAI